MNRREILTGSTLVLGVGIAGTLGATATNDDTTTSSENGTRNEARPDSDSASNSRQCSEPDSEIDEENPAEEIAIKQLNEGEVTTTPSTRDWDIDIPDTPSVSEAVQIGASTDSHWVVVLAESETLVELSIQTEDGDPVHHMTASLSPSLYAALRFEKPDTYVIECSTGSDQFDFQVRELSIDCNRSTQTILLCDDGSIKESYISTLLGCSMNLDELQEDTITSLEDQIEELDEESN